MDENELFQRRLIEITALNDKVFEEWNRQLLSQLQKGTPIDILNTAYGFNFWADAQLKINSLKKG
jgi:hypothetical protein